LQGFTKDVLEKGDDLYNNFSIEGAVQTTDVIGKHIYEFQRKDKEKVPEIFVLIVSFFEINSNLLKTEGLFRIGASLDKIDEL